MCAPECSTALRLPENTRLWGRALHSEETRSIWHSLRDKTGQGFVLKKNIINSAEERMPKAGMRCHLTMLIL